jgi:chaperonin GroES
MGSVADTDVPMYGMRPARVGALWAKDLYKPNYPEPIGWRILVKIRDVKEVTKGGIVLPQTVIDNQRALMMVGQVVAVGPLAFQRADMKDVGDWYRPGDFVMFGKYNGARFMIGGEELRLMNEDEVLGLVPDPNAVRDASGQIVSYME